MKRKKQLQIGSTYALLILLSFIWLFPIVWVILTSFRGEGTAYVPYIIILNYLPILLSHLVAGF